MNLRPYLGLPYADHGRGDGFDCWGLIRHVLGREYGMTLPDYGDRYAAATDKGSVAVAIRDGLVEGWSRIPGPQTGALVIFNILAKPWHVGLVVGRDRFLHMPAKGISCVERLSAPCWSSRIEGFYDYG